MRTKCPAYRARCLLGVAAACIAFQFTPARGETYTFDTTSSISFVRWDYRTPLVTGFMAWTPVDAGNNLDSGSLQLSLNLQSEAEMFNPGYSLGRFALDLFNSPGRDFTKLSFDMLVAPFSAKDPSGGHGFFQVLTVNEPAIVNQLHGELLGNPTWTNNLSGTWQHFDLVMEPTRGDDLRGLMFQVFGGSGIFNVNGDVTLFIDNLTLVPVPEPSSMALLMAGVSSLLWARRRSGLRVNDRSRF